VNFIFDILNVWKKKEDKKTGRWESRKHSPSIIDPAVGDGIFLKSALEKNFTLPKYVFGVDIDEEAKEKWVKINLLKSFGSRAELDNHFYHQNGLLPLDETKVFRHKTGGLKEFDIAVGNPPYGGIGVDFGGKLTSENMKLLEALEKFDIFSHKKIGNIKKTETNGQNSLFFGDEVSTKQRSVGRKDLVGLAHGMPIEILFVERFIQLVKPNGWIAVIIPDGILSNSNAHYVRDFIASKTKIEAIVSLPRETFKHAGTGAKTSILFLKKLPDKEKFSLDYRVFLASVEKISKENFQTVEKSYQKFYN